MNRAKKVATFRDKYFTSIEYEYRGHKYDVTYANDMSCCCTPAHIQHRDAQERIDKEIDLISKKTLSIDWKNEIDDIWKMNEWDD